MFLCAVFFPKLFTLFGMDWFMSKMLSFFYKTLEDVVQQRSKSTVKFNDFIQLASEAIADTKKELHGQSVSMWTTEEVEEIIIAQVFEQIHVMVHTQIINPVFCSSSRQFSCLPDSIRRLRR